MNAEEARILSEKFFSEKVTDQTTHLSQAVKKKIHDACVNGEFSVVNVAQLSLLVEWT